MNKRITLIALVLVALISGAAGYWLQQNQAPATTVSSAPPTKSLEPAITIGDQRPEFYLADLDGELRNITEFDGNVVMLNFWATWCPPCLKEIPAFQKVYADHREQGFEIVGVAIDDINAVKSFVELQNMQYPVWQGGSDATQLSREYGNSYGALPYSVIFDRNGKIHTMHSGELSEEKLRRVLARLL